MKYVWIGLFCGHTYRRMSMFLMPIIWGQLKVFGKFDFPSKLLASIDVLREAHYFPLQLICNGLNERSTCPRITNEFECGKLFRMGVKGGKESHYFKDFLHRSAFLFVIVAIREISKKLASWQSVESIPYPYFSPYLELC